MAPCFKKIFCICSSWSSWQCVLFVIIITRFRESIQNSFSNALHFSFLHLQLYSNIQNDNQQSTIIISFARYPYHKIYGNPSTLQPSIANSHQWWSQIRYRHPGVSVTWCTSASPRSSCIPSRAGCGWLLARLHTPAPGGSSWVCCREGRDYSRRIREGSVLKDTRVEFNDEQVAKGTKKGRTGKYTNMA